MIAKVLSAGLLALLVDGAGVAVVLHPEGTHGFEDFGEERCGGVGVHVDSAHGSILQGGGKGKDIPQGLKPCFCGKTERAKPEGLAYLEATATAKAAKQSARKSREANAMAK